MTGFILFFLQIYLLILMGRALLSWFPLRGAGWPPP